MLPDDKVLLHTTAYINSGAEVLCRSTRIGRITALHVPQVPTAPPQALIPDCYIRNQKCYYKQARKTRGIVSLQEET
jgi:hypothetical protein